MPTVIEYQWQPALSVKLFGCNCIQGGTVCLSAWMPRQVIIIKVQTAKPPLLVKKLPKIKIRPPPKNKKKPLTFFNNIILSRFSETTNLNFSMEYLDNDIDKNYQFGGRFHVKMCTFWKLQIFLKSANHLCCAYSFLWCELQSSWVGVNDLRLAALFELLGDFFLDFFVIFVGFFCDFFGFLGASSLVELEWMIYDWLRLNNMSVNSCNCPDHAYYNAFYFRWQWQWQWQWQWRW